MISIGPEFIKVEVKDVATDKITIGPEVDLTAETGTKIIIEEEETAIIEVVIETTDPIIGIIVSPKTETITEMAVGTIIDQIIEGMIVTKCMVTEIRTAVGLEKGIEIGVAQEKVPNPEVAISLRTEMRVGDRVEIILGTDLNQEPGQLLMKVKIGIDVGAIDAMSMIILQENALMM